MGLAAPLLQLLVHTAAFVFSVILLGLMDYLLFYFKQSIFGRPIRVLGSAVLFLTASTTLNLMGAFDILPAEAAEPAAQALLVLFLLVASYTIAQFKHAFEQVEWLREQWIHQLEERWARERTQKA